MTENLFLLNVSTADRLLYKRSSYCPYRKWWRARAPRLCVHLAFVPSVVVIPEGDGRNGVYVVGPHSYGKELEDGRTAILHQYSVQVEVLICRMLCLSDPGRLPTMDTPQCGGCDLLTLAARVNGT